MVTTRAMFRQSHKGGSVSSSSSPSSIVLHSEAAEKLETELRIAATTFPPFPPPVFRADETWSSLRMNASFGHPRGKSAGDITSSSIPRPRSHLRDPRLKAAMAKVLARVDGVSTHRAGVFKARAPPLTTAVVASILHKVDNDLRKIPEGQEVSDVGTGPSPGARFGWKMGPQSDWFEPNAGVATFPGQKTPLPLFDAPPRSSSFVDDATDYVPDDRDPDSLPPLSVRETERYAYLEDDFDAYLGKTMASTTFFPSGTPEEWTLQIYVSGPWNHLTSMTFAIITVFVRPGILLDELQDRLDPISAIDRCDRVLSLGNGRLLQPFTPLSTQGVDSLCVIHVRGRLRGGSSGGNEEDNLAASLGDVPAQGGDLDGLRDGESTSPFSAFVQQRSGNASSGVRASPIASVSRVGMQQPLGPEGMPTSAGRHPAATMSHLIALGERTRGDGTPRIDQRLLLEDSSFNHRITQRQRNPRRRDSEYALAFQRAIAFEDAIPMDNGRLDDMSSARREEQEPCGHHCSVGEHSSVRNRTGVLASPLVESNRVLLRKAITLPSFTGLTRDWVNWNYAVERYFEVHNLGHVLLVGYLQSPYFHFEDNKLVYFTLEMSIAKSAKAQALFRRAPRLNGNAGYLHLYDGYTLSGIAAAPLLLQRLTSFRFQPNEDVFSFVLRLTDLFDELSRLPGAAACDFTDNQKVHYLLSSIRHEKSLAFMYENLQTQQSRGTLTFDLACDDLQLRYEAIKTDELLSVAPRQQAALVAVDTPASVSAPSAPLVPALISTEHKRLNSGRSGDFSLCLAEGCQARERTPLCRLHYAELVCGKTPTMTLRDNLGSVTYDTKEHKAVYPTSVPDERRKTQPRGPKSGPRRQ